MELIAQTPQNVPSSPDFNQSHSHQKSIGYQQSLAPHPHAFSSPAVNVNKSVSGPPTQSLFDSLHAEKLNFQQTPTRVGFSQNNTQNYVTPSNNVNNSYFYNQSLNESIFNQSGFVTSPSRITSPLTNDHTRNQSILNSSTVNYASPSASLPSSNFWVTVYGFPSTATAMIISHFSQCGTIIDKIFPPQNGNWIHLKYLSRLECDKALNYNEKVLNNNLMIGVTRCKDSSVMEKENIENNE